MKHLCNTTVALALLIALGGCSQHGDLPTEHSFIPAPAVMIDPNAILDNGNGTYDIPFSVADDTAVETYRVYLLNPLTGFMELAGTTDTSPAGADLQTGRSVGGYPIGISAVTVENVEGAMTVVVTPDP